MPGPSFSVVMPAFNAGAYIVETVASVVAQTWQDWELVIIDDGSTDGCIDLIRHRFDDARIKIRANARVKGPSGARNTGMLAAQGQFIAFLDADDLWSPNHLARAHRILIDEPSVDALLFDFDVVERESGRSLGSWFQQRKLFNGLAFKQLTDGVEAIEADLILALLQESFFHVQPFVARRAALKEILFEESVKRSEDRDWAIQLVRSGLKLARVRETTSTYFRHANSLTSDKTANRRRTLEDEIFLYSRYQDDRTFSPAQRRLVRHRLAACYTDLAYWCRTDGDARGAVASAWRGLRTKPGMGTAKECIKAVVFRML